MVARQRAFGRVDDARWRDQREAAEIAGRADPLIARAARQGAGVH